MRLGELTPEDASCTLAATPPQKSLKVMLSRCMTGKRRTPAEEKVLGFSDTSRAHCHSPARRTTLIKEQSMYGRKDAAQCFDVACENAMTAMGYDTGQVFALCVSFERSCHVSNQIR